MTFRTTDILNLIRDHGKNLTYTSKGSATYDPTTGNNSPWFLESGVWALNGSWDDSVAYNYTPTPTITVKGYFYNYSVSDLTGSSIITGDRRLVLPLTDTSSVSIPAPKKGDTFAGEGDTVVVVSVERIMSGSNPVCYICQVRE